MGRHIQRRMQVVDEQLYAMNFLVVRADRIATGISLPRVDCSPTLADEWSGFSNSSRRSL